MSVREDWLFDRVQAEVVYRTEELHRARGNGGNNLRRWWRLRRREITVPEQRSPGHDQPVGSRAA